MERYCFTVTEADAGKSVKEYLLNNGFSITQIKKAKRGEILLCDKPVTVRATVSVGDTLLIVFPDESSGAIEPIDIPIRAVYEDKHILVADKPTGMPTHPSRGNSLPTLANAVMARYGEGFVFRAITRLDRDTSGLVLIAKDGISAFRLSKDIKAGLITKKYEALVSGVPSEPKGIVDAPIRRVSEGDIKRGVFADGKRALTEYKITSVIDGNALCEVTLHTGRTHQIRVHMAHIGHPLVGDFLYGERRAEGYFLRCNELKFRHPITEKIIHIKI